MNNGYDLVSDNRDAYEGSVPLSCVLEEFTDVADGVDPLDCDADDGLEETSLSRDNDGICN